jgi:hypothetical protein
MFSACALAASKAEEKQKKEEEELRKEALGLVDGSAIGKEGEGMFSAFGRFAVARELVADGKPFPKLIGYLRAREGTLQVMVASDAMLNHISGCDGKDVTLTGKILDKGDRGKFFVVTDVIMPPPPAEGRKKRGGLP